MKRAMSLLWENVRSLHAPQVSTRGEAGESPALPGPQLARIGRGRGAHHEAVPDVDPPGPIKRLHDVCLRPGVAPAVRARGELEHDLLHAHRVVEGDLPRVVEGTEAR